MIQYDFRILDTIFQMSFNQGGGYYKNELSEELDGEFILWGKSLDGWKFAVSCRVCGEVSELFFEIEVVHYCYIKFLIKNYYGLKVGCYFPVDDDMENVQFTNVNRHDYTMITQCSCDPYNMTGGNLMLTRLKD